ncbi:MAG: cobalt transport protein CbiN [Methanolinea sp.]|nr:cobalt transport protein CbiN [Methanolinea sp.]
MKGGYTLEILAVVAVVSFCVLFLVTGPAPGEAEFSGTDTVGSAKVSELSGIPLEEFHPLVPQWEPPSGEVESGLFALQAAAGGIVVGWVFGYWKGQKRADN